MNNNIVKTFFLLLFVLMGQISLMAEKGENKIIYKQGKHIHIVKDKEDNIIKAWYDGNLIKEIDIRPSDSLIIYFGVLSDNGYQLKFPLDRSENRWPGDNGVDKKGPNNFLYKLSSSTEKIKKDDNITKATIDGVIATKYKFSKENQGKSLSFINKENEEDTVLKINVLKPVVFEGLNWCVDSVGDKLVYSSEPKSISLKNINDRIKLVVEEEEFLKGEIIKLAAFSINNNTADSILSWEMESKLNLYTEKTGLSVYSAIDTSLLSNYQDNIDGPRKEYFIGINKDKLSLINNHKETIPYTFTTNYGSIKGEEIPKLDIKVVKKDRGFVASLIENWHWLILGFLIIVVLVFIYIKFIRKAPNEEEEEGCGGRTTPLTEDSVTLGRGSPKTENPVEDNPDEKLNELLKALLQSIILKYGDGKSGDIETFVDKLILETKTLPKSLLGKNILLNNYINNKDESKIEELESLLEDIEKKKEGCKNQEYNFDKLSSIPSTINDFNYLCKELSFTKGSLREDVGIHRDFVNQFNELKKNKVLSDLNFKQNNFATEIINEIKKLKAELNNKENELKKVKEDHILALTDKDKEYEKNNRCLNNRLDRYLKELEARSLDYISGLQFCAEELEKTYERIRSSAQSSDILIKEIVDPVLKGDHSKSGDNTGGLSGFINKLNERNLLMQLMEVSSWEELKEGDAETKRLFVKNIVEGSDFLNIIDLVSALYTYSRVKYKDGNIDIDVSRDFSKRGIDPAEIAIAYGILRSTLNSLFSIEIITCELFKDKLDNSIHEKGNVRRFKDLGDRYLSVEGQVEAQVIVDITKVGLKSEKYNIDRKAQVTYK